MAMKRTVVILAGLLVLALATAGFTPQPAIEKKAIGFTDSAGTVADHSLTDAKVDTTQDWSFIQPSLNLFADGLVLNALWAGVNLWGPDQANDPETSWAACPIITDTTAGGGHTDTLAYVVFAFPMNSWSGVMLGTGSATYATSYRCYAASDTLNPHPGFPGIMFYRKTWSAQFDAFSWVCAKVETRP